MVKPGFNDASESWKIIRMWRQSLSRKPSFSMILPSSRICPLSALSAPESNLAKVLLPEPVSPIIAMVSPCPKQNEISLRTENRLRENKPARRLKLFDNA